MTLLEIQKEITSAIKELDAAIQELKEANIAHARATHTYRQRKGTGYLQFQADSDTNKEKRTVDWIRSAVDVHADREMFDRDMSKGLAEAQMQLVLSLRTKISAFQSLLNAHKAEANAVQFGQTHGA